MGGLVSPGSRERARSTSKGRIALAILTVAFAWVGKGPSGAEAQSVRVTGVTSLRYVEVRPLARDSVMASDLPGSGLLRITPDGEVLRCLTGAQFCHGTRPADPVSTVPFIQDLEASAWGLGRGVRAFAHLRIRSGWGDEPDLWPRASDAWDLLAAYGELDRELYRIRVGRQWTTSGLGFYNFDGILLTARPLDGLSIEGGAGRTLLRGMSETRTGEALAAIEDLAPFEPGLMLTAQARFRPTPALALAGLYHRDVRDDRAGLYAELARFEGVFRFPGGSLETSVEKDLAGNALNEARVRARLPPWRNGAVALEVRRYRPYFELWTIWGAFSPVGFDEARAELTWARGRGDLILRGEATHRRYDDTGMETAISRLRTDGWSLGTGWNWAVRSGWRAEGGYRVEVGFGAARSEGHLGVLRSLDDRGHVALRGVAFQRLYEFRLSHGAVIGMGAEASYRMTSRSRASGSLTGYRHLDRADQPQREWNQLRGSLRLEWTLGPEPGLAPTAGGGG